MLASARTYALHGVHAREVTVEVDIRKGLPAFSIVGLPDAAIRESRERVRAALSNSGFEFPQQRITASLAPADLRKAGPAFDLAIAAALLCAMHELPAESLETCALAGELGLDGTLRSVPGTLAMAEEAQRSGVTRLAVAAPSAPEAALVVAESERPANGNAPSDLSVVPITSVRDLKRLGTADEPAPVPPLALEHDGHPLPDLADLRGQPVLRRALEIAAAGGHGLLVIGPPGAGKSMAARRLPSLLPGLSRPEALEVARIASACGRAASIGKGRPFRAPHHTISPAGLVGGGNPPRPGEVTLAHRGLLFLDELAEFSRESLEALRQPLEDGQVVIARSRHVVRLPCRFQLAAAANPCPCGRGSGSERCSCGPAQIRRYSGRLSGALADRVDISLRVEQPSADALRGEPGEPSAAVRERVLAARERQAHRLGEGRCNAEMAAAETRPACTLSDAAEELLADGHARLGLSGRGYERVLRVARTIADLAVSQRVEADHLSEALLLRRRASGPADAAERA